MTEYIFKAGNPDLPPILLLHSTGGDEHQLLPIAEMIAPNYPVLSIRGRISDNGINRYFKLRGAGGFTKTNFDLESLELESDWLAKEIKILAQKHGFDPSRLIVAGYSNGANVALYMQLKGLFNFVRIIAFHAMPLTEFDQVNTENPIPVFLSHAENDPIIPSSVFQELLTDLENAGCQPEIFKSSHGHQLTEEELITAKNWLEKQ